MEYFCVCIKTTVTGNLVQIKPRRSIQKATASEHLTAIHRTQPPDSEEGSEEAESSRALPSEGGGREADR